MTRAALILALRSSAQPHTEKPEAHSDGDRCCDGHGVRYPIVFPNHAAILADCVAPEAMLVHSLQRAPLAAFWVAPVLC
jgi:hypothetical protein